MRPIATLVLLGGALVAAPLTLSLHPALAAAVTIAACALASAVACEGAGLLSLAAGALAALAFHALSGTPVVAGAFVVALVLAPRSLRGPTPTLRRAHLAVSLAAGLTAALVAARYGGAAEAAVRGAALVVAGILASVTQLLPADDAVTFELLQHARAVPDATSALLVRAAELRRRVRESPAVEALSDDTAARVEAAWRALAALAAQRASMGPAAAPVLDRRIAEHVESLARIHAAADERFVRAAGFGDGALAAANAEGETLETEVRALAEAHAAASSAQGTAHHPLAS